MVGNLFCSLRNPYDLNSYICASLIFLLGSALDTNPLKLLVVGMMAIAVISNIRKDEWAVNLSRSFFCVFLIIVLCLFNSIYFYFFVDFWVEKDALEQILAIRKFAIEAVFSVFLYLYLKNFSARRVLDLVYLGALLNCMIAVVEAPVAIMTEYRASMLFFEPSSAGFYYCYCLFLLFYGAGDCKYRKTLALSFSVLGLVSFSKAQFLVMILLGVIFLRFKYKLLILVAMLLSYTFFEESIFGIYVNLIDLSKHVWGIDKLISALWEHGISGLSSDYDVTDTYVTRLSAIYVSLITLFEYPFGIGVGTFNLWYKHFLIESNLFAVFSGGEVDLMFTGEAYASTRSSLLSLLVGSGFVGVLAFGYIAFNFFTISKKARLLWISFISLTLAAFFLELNPVLDYYIVLIVLLEKASRGEEIDYI